MPSDGAPEQQQQQQQQQSVTRAHLNAKELLSLLGAEVDRLGAQHEAALVQGQRLTQENARLRSHFDEHGHRAAPAVALGTPRTFAGDSPGARVAPSLPGTVSSSMELGGSGLRGSAGTAGGPPRPPSSDPRPGVSTKPGMDAVREPPQAGLHRRGPSPAASQPVSLTSTPASSPRLDASCPNLPLREPPVLRVPLDGGLDSEPADLKSDTWVRHLFPSPRTSHETKADGMRRKRPFIGAIGQFVNRHSLQGPAAVTRSLDQKQKPTLRAVVGSSWFDGVFSVLILVNAIFMAVEAQYNGMDYARTVSFPGATLTAKERWPGAEEVFLVADWIFGILFLLETVLKFVALKIDYGKSAWNIFDTVVVGLWLFQKVARSLFLQPTVMRLGRMVRLVRLARMVRTIQAFDSLQVLLGSIQASVAALFWSSCLLLLIQLMVGLTLHTLLGSYMNDPDEPEAMRQQIYRYFGSFTRSMISMFELTLANWPQICWMLVNHVSQWYGLIILVYKITCGFAILIVINGVFLHETFKVASDDEDMMLFQKQRATKNHVRKMEMLFKAADTSCDGLIDRDEFKKVLRSPKVRTWLSAMELEVSDPDILFNFLDDGDETITVAELINGVARLKGSARNIDVVAVLHSITKLHDMLEDMQTQVSALQQKDRSELRKSLTAGTKPRRDNIFGLREKRRLD